ncbi:MAG: two-component regulator propeller domain-containing protein [Cellvibrionaceae bacterium]
MKRNCAAMALERVELCQQLGRDDLSSRARRRDVLQSLLVVLSELKLLPVPSNFSLLAIALPSVFLLLFLSVLSTVARANFDDEMMEQITLREGLSQSTVFSIEQDTTGFIWFGTRNGLNRFDGYQFRHYMSEQGLPSSFIWSVVRDGESLWLGTQGGGLVKRLPSGEFVTYPTSEIRSLPAETSLNDSSQPDPATTRPSSERRAPLTSQHSPVKVIVDIELSVKGGLWLATQDAGLQYFDKQTQQFTRHGEGLGDSIWSVMEDSSGSLWVGSAEQGLFRFDTQADRWTQYRKSAGDINSLSHNSVWKVLEDSTRTIWVATFGGGLNRLDTRTGEFTHYRLDVDDPESLSNDFVWTIFEDRQGRLWVGTNGGLNLFDRKTETFSRFLLGQEIKSIFEDSSGILWVGTYYGGVFKLDEKRNKFNLMRHQLGGADSLASDTVNGLWQEDDGTLWVVGDGGGVSRIDGSDKSVRYFQHDPQDPASISNNHPMNIMRLRNGDYLLGNYSGGMNRFNPNTEVFTRYLPDTKNESSISDDTVFDIVEDEQGRVWVGTWRGGLNQYHPETGEFSIYRHDPNNPESLADDYVQVLLADSHNRLWVGTASAGLQRFYPEENRFQSFKHDSSDPSSISHNHVYSLTERKDGKLWVGTEHGGLNLFDPVLGTFEHFIDSQNYLQTAILGILDDERGHLWLSTRDGLLRFNPETGFAQRYDEGDGVQSREFIAGSELKGREGYLYFGGVGGLNFFRPQKVENNQFVPPVVITKLSVLQSQNERDIYVDQQQTITLDFDDQPFALDFSALSYSRSEQNRYRYKLEGVDRSWLSNSADHRAVYHRVGPGNYEFKVRGANNDGVWNAIPATLTIIVKPPWWLSLWAYLLYALVICVLAFFYWGWRHRTLTAERDRDVAQRSEQAKQEFLAKMSHEIRTPLSGMLGMSELLERTSLDFTQKHYVKSQISAGHSLLKIINDILEFSKIEANKLQLMQKPFSLRRLLNDLIDLFQIETERREISLTLNYSESVPDQFWGDPVRVRQVLSNLIGNAVKFTEEGGVWIEVTATRIGESMADLVIEVKDSGIGIEPQKLQSVFGQFYQANSDIQHNYGGTGLGLSISRQLVELMDGSMTLQSQYGVGTTAKIEVSLPLANDDHDIGEALSVDSYRSRAHVLVVEDNEINALALMHLLTDFGCNVEIVGDGFEAVRYLEMNSVDLVFMDRHMPKMNGIEATQKIRAIDKLKHLPIVALTASVSLQDKAECLNAGMNEYLLKPLLREKALRVLNKYCHHLQCKDLVSIETD